MIKNSQKLSKICKIFYKIEEIDEKKIQKKQCRIRTVTGPNFSQIGQKLRSNIDTLFPILPSTFSPNLKQISRKMTKLLNGRHFEGGAAGNGAAAPRAAPYCSGNIASRCLIL